MYVKLRYLQWWSVQIMILVDQAGGKWPSINHSPWNGVTLADFVMPFFLFIVGVALALTYQVKILFVMQCSTFFKSITTSSSSIYPAHCCNLQECCRMMLWECTSRSWPELGQSLVTMQLWYKRRTVVINQLLKFYVEAARVWDVNGFPALWFYCLYF